MTEFNHEERLSRQQAAERVADIAYALAAGGTLELNAEGERVRVPLAADVLVRRESKSHGDGVWVEVRLSWSTRAYGGRPP